MSVCWLSVHPQAACPVDSRSFEKRTGVGLLLQFVRHALELLSHIRPPKRDCYFA